jgi:hypothetical protein
VESNLLPRAWGQVIDRGTPGIITTCNVDLPYGEKERTARNAENDYILEIGSQHREQAHSKVVPSFIVFVTPASLVRIKRSTFGVQTPFPLF